MATNRANNFWEVLANAGAAGLQGAGNALEKQEQKRKSDAMNLFAMAGQVAEQERAKEMHGLAMTKAMLDNKLADEKLWQATDPVAYSKKLAEAKVVSDDYISANWKPTDVSGINVDGFTPVSLPPGVQLLEEPKDPLALFNAKLDAYQKFGAIPGVTTSGSGEQGGVDDQMRDLRAKWNDRRTTLQRHRSELLARGKDEVGMVTLDAQKQNELDGIAAEEEMLSAVQQAAYDFFYGHATKEQILGAIDSNPELDDTEKARFKKELSFLGN